MSPYEKHNRPISAFRIHITIRLILEEADRTSTDVVHIYTDF